MRTIFNPNERARLLRRVNTLRADTPARWGKMNSQQMICHLHDALASSFGPPPEPGSGPLSRFPLKQLVIWLLPWPKGKLQSPPDLLRTRPQHWQSDIQAFTDLLHRVASRNDHGNWPASEVFGHLSRHEWGALLRTHIDHHLRQFGA
jgi:hypothetical protein